MTVELNHVMIYSDDVPRATSFYRERLGFQLIETYGEGYARLRAPAGSGTIGLHSTREDARRLHPDRAGIRLYFEVRELDQFCSRLAAEGVAFDQMPQDMPWGWRHAYLKDPDGNELSLYWAGDKRFEKTSP